MHKLVAKQILKTEGCCRSEIDMLDVCNGPWFSQFDGVTHEETGTKSTRGEKSRTAVRKRVSVAEEQDCLLGNDFNDSVFASKIVSWRAA